MEKWFEEVKNHSHRDQLSFNYVLWKCPEIKISYMRKDIYKSEWFKWNGGHSKAKKATSNTGTTANKIEKSTRPRKTIEQLKKHGMHVKKLLKKNYQVRDYSLLMLSVAQTKIHVWLSDSSWK
jgi:hypothetical protein